MPSSRLHLATLSICLFYYLVQSEHVIRRWWLVHLVLGVLSVLKVRLTCMRGKRGRRRKSVMGQGRQVAANLDSLTVVPL